MKCAPGIAVILLATAATAQDDGAMSFFVTSENPGSGGDFGGLAGADAHCTALAEAAGVTGRTWAAYLSTQDENARDRIGSGPWMNVEGVEIAAEIETLDGENNISTETALDENGAVIDGRRHDILTGSLPDGTVAEQTCEGWTSAAEDGSGFVGHHNRTGLDDSASSRSWNSSHPSRGCHLEGLRGTAGDGLVYCFAVE